jgi:hypothetical protein
VIRANDDSIALTQTTLTVLEGQNAEITVLRTGSSLGAVTVSYSVSNGTALMGSDFWASPTGSVTIAAGSTTAVISIPIVDDDVAEGPETFSVDLTAVSGDAVLSLPTSIVVTIPSNDGASGVFGFVDSSSTQYVINEGATYTFTIARNLTDIYGVGSGLVPATVQWSIIPLNSGQRDPATDFTETSGTLQFAVGVQVLPIVVEVLTDSLPEVLHAYTIQITNPSGDGRLCTVPCGNQRRIITIPSNQNPHGDFHFNVGSGSLQVGEAAVNVAGGASRTLWANISRGGGSIGDVDVTVQANFNGSGAVFV